MGQGALAVLVVFWLFVGGAVGYAIGETKGQGGLGFLLGLVLGFVGWIIIAVMEPSDEVRAIRNVELASASAAVWQDDPFNRYQYRYFDGRRSTEHVSNAGNVSADWAPLTPTGAQVTPAWFPDPVRRHVHRY